MLSAIFPTATMAVGSSNLPGGGRHAVSWSWTAMDAGSMTITDLGVMSGALPDTSGHISSFATSYTSNGMIAGSSNSAYPYARGNGYTAAVHAFLYADRIIDLSTLAGVHYNSAGLGVNDYLEIVGHSDILAADGSIPQRAFLYAKGVMYDVNSLLVNTVPAPLTNAIAIDCQGNIAAIADPTPNGTFHAYLLIRQGSARSCPN